MIDGVFNDLPDMKIVLIGYMGSGKSSVAEILSEKLNIPFKDLDEEIQKVEKLSIPKIFSEKGEIYFRRLENKTIKELLTLNEKFVLATGGGTPCYADSLSQMKNAKDTVTIYLKTPLPILCERLMNEKGSRPLISHLNTEEELLEFVGIHLFERSHFYNQASLIIETANDSPKQIAERIVKLLF